MPLYPPEWNPEAYWRNKSISCKSISKSRFYSARENFYEQKRLKARNRYLNILKHGVKK